MMVFLRRIKNGITRRANMLLWKFKRTYRLLLLRTVYRLSIMNSEKTISYIKTKKCSIARYGDGEFNIMLRDGCAGFQDYSEEMSRKLAEVIKNADANLLVCIPWSFYHLRYRNQKSKQFWKDWTTIQNKQKRIVEFIREQCGQKHVFGDSQITRPYIAMKSYKRAETIFPKLKSLWEDRDLLFVEGEQTRMGVGNDLFDNAKSISRILAPAKNCFEYYDEIVQSVVKNYNGQMILLALGPTATILAADLSKYGMQALDIGHIDVEYEWYTKRVSERVELEGKYVNEVVSGHQVSPCLNADYLEQIVDKVGC